MSQSSAGMTLLRALSSTPPVSTSARRINRGETRCSWPYHTVRPARAVSEGRSPRLPSRSRNLHVNIVHLGYGFDADLATPEALLGRYNTLTEWCEALRSAGASRVTVVQRFHKNERLTRNDVDYILIDDGGRGYPRPRVWSAAIHRVVAGLAPDVAHVNGLSFPLQTWLLRRALPSRTAIVAQDHASGEPRVAPSGVRRIQRLIHCRAWRAVDAFFFTAASQADPWRTAGCIAPHQSVYQVAEASTLIQPVWRSVARSLTGIEGD